MVCMHMNWMNACVCLYRCLVVSVCLKIGFRSKSGWCCLVNRRMYEISPLYPPATRPFCGDNRRLHSMIALSTRSHLRSPLSTKPNWSTLSYNIPPLLAPFLFYQVVLLCALRSLWLATTTSPIDEKHIWSTHTTPVPPTIQRPTSGPSGPFNDFSCS